MNILCIGDIVGRPGREVLARVLPLLKKEYAIDFVIANAENASGGGGLLPKNAQEILDAGVDVMTLGDHVWDKPDVNLIWDKTERLVRPANFPEGTPGRGYTIVKASNGVEICVMNLLGRTFMKYNVDCPFRSLEKIIGSLPKRPMVTVLDMHAETTSEKVAMSYFANGKVSIVYGTHTHVQTADEIIRNQGTAYITDLGMTGPYDSVIGQQTEKILARFWTSMPQKFEVAINDPKLSGIVVNVDQNTGKALTIKRICQGG